MTPSQFQDLQSKYRELQVTLDEVAPLVLAQVKKLQDARLPEFCWYRPHAVNLSDAQKALIKYIVEGSFSISLEIGRDGSLCVKYYLGDTDRCYLRVNPRWLTDEGIDAEIFELRAAINKESAHQASEKELLKKLTLKYGPAK